MLFANANLPPAANPFNGFDLFMFAFTILLFIGLFRQVKMEEKNKFAIGFTGIALATCVVLDAVIVMNWFDMV